jgi:hypothetical protein
MTLDPRWSIFLSVGLAVLAYLNGAGALLTDLGMSATQVKVTMALISLVLGLGNTINAVLTGIPSKDNQTGFIVKGPGNPPKGS